MYTVYPLFPCCVQVRVAVRPTVSRHFFAVNYDTQSGKADPRKIAEIYAKSPRGRGAVPGGSKELGDVKSLGKELRTADTGRGGSGEESAGANVARRRRPVHAGREPQRRRAVHRFPRQQGFSWR
jgi:hypothetical protein